MLEKWKVTYLIENEVLVKTPVLTYTSLDLELQYNEDKLIKCEHTVEIQGLASEEVICQLSNIQLRLFWELIQYKQRKSIQFKGAYAEKVIEEIDRPDVAERKERILLRDTRDAIVHQKVNMPTEYQLARSNNQLSTWIHFANQAYDSNDVEAVRIYYIIYEGIYPCKSKWKNKAKRLKYTRDFISHGEPLNNKELLQFIGAELGDLKVNQFDPYNLKHLNFIRKQREEARRLIESELNSSL